MKLIGVIGAGTMGRGVAQNLAQFGFNVIVLDISEEILKEAKQDIYNNSRLQALFNKELCKSPDEILNKICFSTNYNLLSEVDYIIENVPENWQIKKAVYKSISSICPSNCIFAVNTSCMSITKIASFTDRPLKVIGVHFMNPVPLKPVVEVVKGYHTSDETIRLTNEMLLKMGKESIIVKDYPGFVANRISHLFMNEAANVIQDQVANAEQVDEVFKKCYGHKMGPLETADLIGLDTVVNSLDVLYESYQDTKFRCSPLLRKMVDAGLLGMKTGEGFYKY